MTSVKIVKEVITTFYCSIVPLKMLIKYHENWYFTILLPIAGLYNR